MEIFTNGDYKLINEMIESRIPILRKNENFNKKYLRLTDLIDGLEKKLSNGEKEKFQEIVDLFYETEEYYFALSYSLGVKHGKDLENLK